MRAVVCESPGVVRVSEIVLSDPGPGEVLLSVAASRVCGSDARVANGTSRIAQYPMVLGHEAAGTIVGVGHGVSDDWVGVTVVAIPGPACGSCAPCRRRDFGGCSGAARERSRRGLDIHGRTRHCRQGLPVFAYLGLGALSEMMVVHLSQIVRVPTGVEAWQAAAVACGHLAGMSAVKGLIGGVDGTGIVIIGCGAVGLGAIHQAVFSGVALVHAVDPSRDARLRATRSGATSVSRSNADSKIVAGLVIEASGTSAGFDAAMAATAPGGTMLSVGSPPSGSTLTVDADWLHGRRTLRGSTMGGSNPAEDLPLTLALLATRQLEVGSLILANVELQELSGRLRPGSLWRRS